jgi:hypothetical protein
MVNVGRVTFVAVDIGPFVGRRQEVAALAAS